MSKIKINRQDLYHSYLESNLLGKIKHKTSPPAPLLIKERGAVKRAEVNRSYLFLL